MSDRKIDKFVVCPNTEEEYSTIFALTDRGEVFFMIDPGGGHQSDWALLPPLPQGDIVPFVPDESDDEESDEEDDDPNEEA